MQVNTVTQEAEIGGLQVEAGLSKVKDLIWKTN
jgi:hypothetical protein